MMSPSIGKSMTFQRTTMQDSRTSNTLLVDGIAFTYHLFHQADHSPWWSGGDMRRFQVTIEEFVTRMREFGFELRFVFDGMVDPMKYDTVMDRFRQNTEKVESFMRSAQWKSVGERDRGKFVLPFGVIDCMMDVLKARGVSCRRSLYEADGELAEECLRTSAFGVLSNDSDFLCMRVPFVPLNEMMMDENTFQCVIYDPVQVSNCVGIAQECLPMLACMCGNDFIKREDLFSFHESLVPLSRSNRNWMIIREVANVLRSINTWDIKGDPSPQDDMNLVRRMFNVLEEGEAGQKLQLVQSVRRKYLVQAAPKPPSQADPGAADECFSYLQTNFAQSCLHQDILQIFSHQQLWCRLSIEHNPPNLLHMGAHQRSSRVRKRLVSFVLGKVKGEEMMDDGESFVLEHWQWGSEYRRSRLKLADLPYVKTSMRQSLRLSDQQRQELFLELVEIPSAIREDFIKGVGTHQHSPSPALGQQDFLLLAALYVFFRSDRSKMPQMKFRLFSALIATCCLLEEHFKELENLRSQRPDDEGDVAFNVMLTNLSQSFLVHLSMINAVNDALQRPFPYQHLCLISPWILQALMSDGKDILSGMKSFGLAEQHVEGWFQRFQTISSVLNVEKLCREEETSKTTARAKQDKPKRAKNDHPNTTQKPSTGSLTARNIFNMLTEMEG